MVGLLAELVATGIYTMLCATIELQAVCRVVLLFDSFRLSFTVGDQHLICNFAVYYKHVAPSDDTVNGAIQSINDQISTSYSPIK